MRGTNGGERRRVAPASTRAPNPTGPLGTFGLAVMAVMAVLLLGTVVSAPAQAAEPTPAATAEATPSEPGPDPGIVRSYGDDTRIPPPLRGRWRRPASAPDAPQAPGPTTLWWWL